MTNAEHKPRIWELDALRGFMILCVILSHLAFDIESFYPESLQLPGFVRFVFDYGGVLFVVLSGICATLGSRSLRRGVLVFACGLGLELVSIVLAHFGFISEDTIIRFGILHLLGACMMLYPILRKLPDWWVAVLGAVIIVLGYWFTSFRVETGYLYAFGLCSPDFASGDYFPLLPNLGWFCAGIALGRLLYRKQQSLLPKVNANFFVWRFLRFCGRQSLFIYLAHQPILFGLLLLISNA